MPMPPLDSTAGATLRDVIYSNAHIKADKETVQLVGTLSPHQVKLKKAIGARNDADTAAIEASAVTDAAWTGVRAALQAFGTKAFGHFVKRTEPGYLRIFALSPTDLLGLTEDKRKEALDKVLKAGHAKETPKELAAPVAAFAVALQAWQDVQTAEAAAVEGYQDKVGALKVAVDEALTAVRKLKGQLQTLFPRDARRVQSFFPRRTAGAKKAKAEPEPAPM